MRILSVVICLVFLVGLSLYGVLVGTGQAYFRGAPQIQADIQDRAYTSPIWYSP